MRRLLYIVITILFICGNAFLKGQIGGEVPFFNWLLAREEASEGDSQAYEALGELFSEDGWPGEDFTGESLEEPGSLGESTFSWDSLKETFLQIRNSYTEYGNLDGLSYEIRDGRAMVTGYDGEEERITLPAVINGYAVTEIGAGAFWGNTLLKSLVCEGEIEIVGDRAFTDCSALETVEIGDKVSRMGQEVLSGTRLRSLQQMEQGYVALGNMLLEAPVSGEFFIPEEVTGIGAGCFRNNENVTEVLLPEGFLYLGEEAFASCPNLKRVVFPAGMEEIGNGAFCWCENITEITFTGSVRRIGDSAFEGCKQYGDITFPEGLEEIGARAFWECGQMTSIVIPGTVKTIGDGAFCNLGMLGTPQNLTRLELKEGVEQVGREAFQYVMADEILLPDSLVLAGENAFTVTEEMEAAPGMYVADGVLLRYKGEETTPVVPEGVRMILGNAFRDNQNIVSVTLPEGLRLIGGSAFENCGALSWLKIPDSVETIGDRAFADCRSLTVVEGYENVARKGEEIFEGSGMAAGE